MPCRGCVPCRPWPDGRYLRTTGPGAARRHATARSARRTSTRSAGSPSSKACFIIRYIASVAARARWSAGEKWMWPTSMDPLLGLNPQVARHTRGALGGPIADGEEQRVVAEAAGDAASGDTRPRSRTGRRRGRSSCARPRQGHWRRWSSACVAFARSARAGSTALPSACAAARAGSSSLAAGSRSAVRSRCGLRQTSSC